jgi:hypothetical protein
MRSKIIATVLALGTLLSVPAMAGERGDKDAAFPMPAATFQAKVSEREAKAREHMEARAAKLSQDEANALRARFNDGEAKINAEVAKITADGTVTKDEAKEFHQVLREVRPWHGHKNAKNQGTKQGA